MANCEDLATKAELQELRDQINTLLGQNESGTGTIDVLQAGTLEGTQTFALLALAGTAIQKLVVSGNVGNNLVTALASGGAWFEAIKGNGATAVVNGFKDIGKAVSGNVSKIGTIGTGLANNAGAIFTISNLALGIGNSLISIGTLKLIEQNTKNNEAQFNALNRDYTTLMNFISQQNEDIEEANAANAANQYLINQQIDVNNQQALEIELAQSNIDELAQSIEQQNQEIERANESIVAFQAQVDAIEEDATEFKAQMQSQVTALQGTLAKNIAINQTQDATIQSLQATVVGLGSYVGQLDRDLFFLAIKLQQWVQILEDLGFDINNPDDLSEVRSNLLEARVIAETKKNEQARLGGGTGTAVGAATAAQNGILNLASNLAGVLQTDVPTITNNDTYNRTTTFTDSLANLISQINIDGTVRDTDVQAIRDGIKLDLEDLMPVLLGATVIPTINTIQNQTRPAALTEAATAGVCNSTQPGGCMQNNVVNPLQNNFSNLVNSAGTAFSAANNALLLQMQGTLGAISATGTTILNTVNSTTHGLAKIQSFAETAWKVTRADKIMQGVSLAMTIHNGMMLSNNLLSTVSEATNMTLNALGIRDETDSPIDFGQAIKSKIEAILVGLVGAEDYAAITARIAKANRIYQSSINVLDTTYSLFDSARNVAELTAENTGKIGNALRESGAVYEDAYDEFLEKVNPQNAAMRRLDKFREGLEDVENVFSTINQVSSEVVEFQENVEQLSSEKDELQQEVTDILEAQAEEKETARQSAEVDTGIEDIDFINSREITSDDMFDRTIQYGG